MFLVQAAHGKMSIQEFCSRVVLKDVLRAIVVAVPVVILAGLSPLCEM